MECVRDDMNEEGVNNVTANRGEWKRNAFSADPGHVDKGNAGC